ncbi:hypothetical protein Bbelb_178570 [Branchiostoma belcheri]|nr:hypothetical protein Bbelb_178570 [Branchiostoma belcheri]
MDPAEDPSKGGAAAPPVIHYHVYNISQVENVQIGTDNVINKIGYEDEIVDGETTAVYAPPPLEMPTVRPSVQPSLPPDVHPQLQLAGSTCPVTGAMGDTNPPPITPNITPSKPNTVLLMVLHQTLVLQTMGVPVNPKQALLSWTLAFI